MNQNYRISVIVPAYNVEKYIEQCLRSIMGQTYKNLEIIVVNDGSKDGTAEVIRRLAEEDKRIIFIDKENSGVSDSRNVALQRVSSDFVMFVDSDDWLDLEACEYVVNEVSKENADILMFGYVREYDGNSLPKAMFDEERLVFEGQDVKARLHRRIFGPVGEELSTPEKLNAITTIWGKIYKAEIIKNIKFVSLQEMGLCEDGFYNISAFERAKKVLFVKKHFYHYRKVISGGSLTQKKDCNMLEKEKKFYGKLLEVIEKEGLPAEYEKALDNRMALSLIECGISIVNSGSNVYDNVRKVLESEPYKKAFSNLELGYFPMHWKLFFWFAKSGFTFGVYLLLNVIVKMMDKK